MHDLDPFAPRHVGSAFAVTGLVVLMLSETPRPENLGLACACLLAALVAFAADRLRRPKRPARRARRPGVPAPVTVDWESVPRVRPVPRLAYDPTLTPALPPPGASLDPKPPANGPKHRRALKDVRDRRIARGT